MTEPTDDELTAIYKAANGEDTGKAQPLTTQRIFRAMRAAIAKWGTLRAEKIVIPTDTMEQEFQKHYQRGYEAGKKATTQQPTQAQVGAVPLTKEQIRAMCKESWVFETAKQWVRITEQHHGITGGQHGAE